MTHKFPELRYAQDALAPRMSEQTIALHYGKHLRTYINNVNRLVIGTPYEDFHLKEIIGSAQGEIYNNAAQAWNHIIFFRQLTPTPKPIGEALNQAIVLRWGNFEKFRAAFTSEALNLFGSGWVWLAFDEQHDLQILSMPNAGNPITKNMHPLMCVDMWEHAYYLDYHNDRAAYLENFWPLINWEYVEYRMTREDTLLYY